MVVFPVGPSLGVIVPAFNEAATLSRLLTLVLAQPCVQQVVVVDDGSSDGTFEQAQRFSADPRLTICRLPVNTGKGAAIRTALDAVRTPVVIIQDADLEYDPRQYEQMMTPILDGRADVVYGVRGFLGHSSYSYWFVVGNRVVTTATNILFNCYIQDMETGFKAFRTDLVRRLRLTGNRFDIEPEITGRVLRLGYWIHEVPITYYARSRAQGKKLTWRDGVRALLTLLRLRCSTYRALFGAVDPYHAQRQAELAALRLPGLPYERVA